MKTESKSLLNKSKYKKLCNDAGEGTLSGWYQESEKVFKKQNKINNKDDFIKMIAFTYSWMPTIPKVSKAIDKDWAKIDSLLKNIKVVGKNSNLNELFTTLVPIINNSIVGTSKVLYFIYPKKIPIIDSNVIVGWREMFYEHDIRKYQNPEIAAFPLALGSSKKHIDLYVQYVENMHTWSKASNVNSIREIEKKLFLLGKSVRKK